MKPYSLIAASTISFLVFLLLAIAVLYSAAFGEADLHLALWINRLTLGDALNSLLVAASMYGREYFWIPVVGLMLLLGDTRTRTLALGLSVLFLAGIAAGELSKAIVMRERIWTQFARFAGTQIFFEIRVLPDVDFSFPSGHALIVSIGAFFTLATFRKKWVALLLTLEAAVVCFSRVYVGAHYPSDVIAGAALGGAIVFGGLALEQKYLTKTTARLTAYLEKAFATGPLKL